jgi:poly-gamma-glutamate capsule biosynthesis protein CapA/YwtB (metallophosphatase superfamily)
MQNWKWQIMEIANKSITAIQIGLMGDVMIGRLVNEQMNHVPALYIWGDVYSLLESNDLNIINLEAALTHSPHLVPKVFNFKADPYKVKALVGASIHVANLANNHILDYSEEGLLETLATLDKAGIKHIGAGRNITEASAPVIIDIKGIKIGILGCTDNEPGWLATQSQPGVKFLEIGNIEAIREDIQKLRPQVNLLILSIHWGPNMVERPSKAFVQFAHDLIDCGVDLIHGHSAHIFQGVEVYKGKLILYDTGDFIDDYYVDPLLRNDRSFLFLVKCTKEGIQELRLIPVLIGPCQVNKANLSEALQIIQRMQKLSKEMKTEFIMQNGELFLHLS